MTLVQNRKKLVLKVYNYSVLDKLDQPIEYRINHQLRARSAEVMYTARPEDFLEPMEVGRFHSPSIYPYPVMIEPQPAGLRVRVQTPIIELAGWCDHRPNQGVTFEGLMGGRLRGYLTAWDPVKQEHNNLKYIAERKERHQEIMQRVNRTWAEALTKILLEFGPIRITYNADTLSICEAFESILKKVPSEDFVTFKIPSLLQKSKQRFANAHIFHFVHRQHAQLLYESLDT